MAAPDIKKYNFYILSVKKKIVFVKAQRLLLKCIYVLDILIKMYVFNRYMYLQIIENVFVFL